MVARVSEASIDLCRLEQDTRRVVRQASPNTSTVEMVEARPVGAPSGGGQRACQVAGHADDLQPSSGSGRLRHRTASAKDLESVPERVNAARSSASYSN